MRGAIEVLTKCGGFAYSVNTHKQVLTFKKVMGNIGYPGKDYTKRLQIHYVLGTSTRSEFKKILKAAASSGIGITPLGYKTTGRGCDFIPQKHLWWMGTLKEVQKEGSYLRIGIDTVIAQEFERELTLSGVSSLLYPKSEGKFSCYIDAVTQEIAPSPFASKEEFKPLPRYNNSWVEVYQKF